MRRLLVLFALLTASACIDADPAAEHDPDPNRAEPSAEPNTAATTWRPTSSTEPAITTTSVGSPALPDSVQMIVDGEADWRWVSIRDPDATRESEDPWLWWGVIVTERAGVEVDPDHLWRQYGQGVVALHPEGRHLLVWVLGGLFECASFSGIEVDTRDDLVRLAPRFGTASGFYGSCGQPTPSVATWVDLGEPLGDRTVTLEQCAGQGFSDCQAVERYEPHGVPVAGEVEVRCVPVGHLMQVGRSMHEHLVACDPDAVPIQGFLD